MSTIAVVLLLAAALAGGFVSRLAGFGTELMALGIWLYVLPRSIAVPLVLICSIVAQTSTMPSIWRTIDFRLVWPFLVGGLAGVPLGTVLVAYADPRLFRLRLSRIEPPLVSRHRAWAFVSVRRSAGLEHRGRPRPLELEIQKFQPLPHAEQRDRNRKR